MSFALVGLHSWHYGYLIVSIVQIILSAIVFMSIPLWKKGGDEEETKLPAKGLSVKEILQSRGGSILLFGVLRLLRHGSYRLPLDKHLPRRNMGILSRTRRRICKHLLYRYYLRTVYQRVFGYEIKR